MSKTVPLVPPLAAPLRVHKSGGTRQNESELAQGLVRPGRKLKELPSDMPLLRAALRRGTFRLSKANLG